MSTVLPSQPSRCDAPLQLLSTRAGARRHGPVLPVVCLPFESGAPHADVVVAFFRTTVANVRPVPSMLGSALWLALGATAAAPAAAQQTGNSGEATQTLDSVVVTGSRLRRVDTETANPVVTVSQEQIAATGKATVGDLLQELPSIAGNATNPYTNNGGGTGASAISLRGLGDKRTLVLVNGIRLAYNDVNAIRPA